MPDWISRMSARIGRIPEPPRRSLMAVTIVLAAFGLYLSRFTIRFGTNDDTTLQLTAMGFYTDGVPSPDLVVAGLPLGFLLKALYTAFPGVQWYSVCLVGSHIAGSVALWYVFLGHRRRGFAWVAFVLAFLVFESELLMWLQFTSATMVLATGGLVLLLDTVHREREVRRVPAIVAGLMISLAGFIRFKAMAACVLLALPLLLIVPGSRLYREGMRFGRPAARMFAACSLVVVVILGGGLAFEKRHYADKPGWADYFDYRAQEVRVLGYPQLRSDPRLPALVARIGWSVNDFLLWYYYFFFDNEIYSKAHLKTMADELQFSMGGETGMRQTRTIALHRYGPHIRVAAAVLLLVLLTAPAASRLVILVVAGWSALVLYGLTTFMRLPAQLGVPVFLVSTVLIALSGCLSRAGAPPRRRMAAAAVPAGLLLFWLVAGLGEQSALSSNNEAAGKSALAEMDALRRYDPNGTFLNWGGVLLVEDIPPFTPPDRIPRLRTLNTGWQTFSPISDAFLNRAGPGDVYRRIFAPRIAGGPNLWVLLPPDARRADARMRLLTRFMDEHYGGMRARARAIRPEGVDARLLFPTVEGPPRPPGRGAP